MTTLKCAHVLAHGASEQMVPQTPHMRNLMQRDESCCLIGWLDSIGELLIAQTLAIEQRYLQAPHRELLSCTCWTIKLGKKGVQQLVWCIRIPLLPFLHHHKYFRDKSLYMVQSSLVACNWRMPHIRTAQT